MHAYATIAPKLHMLRLHYYFGRGEKAVITKLPVELFVAIEELLLSERPRLLEEWQEACLCFEQRCNPTDHFTDQEVDDLFDKLTLDPDSAIMRDQEEKYYDVHHLVDSYLWHHKDDWVRTHKARAEEWKGEDMVGTKEAGGVFDKHSDFVKQYFGLDIWVSRVRHDKSKSHQKQWDNQSIDDMPFEESIAYITYPQHEDFQGLASFSYDELRSGDFAVESGYAMGVEMPPPLSATDRAKFARMMRVLDLEPCEYTEDLHKDNKLVVQQVNRKKAKPRASSWPRLTLLTKASAACYEMPL